MFAKATLKENMGTAKIDERIKALEAKLKQEKAKKTAQLARAKIAENKAKRAAQTRKKILLGTLAENLMQKDMSLFVRMNEEIDRFLTRADDRALFDLPPLQK